MLKNKYERTNNLGKNMTRNIRMYQNRKEDYLDYTLYVRKRKMAHVVQTFIARAGIKQYHLLLTGSKKNPGL